MAYKYYSTLLINDCVIFQTKDENLPIKQEEKFNNAYGYQLIQETDESSEKSNQDDYMKNENSLYRDNEYFKLANKKGFKNF